MDVTGAQVFINEEDIKQKILALTPEEARKLGVKHRSTLKRMKDRIKENGKINTKTKQVEKLVNTI
ncbi:hypothetical protein [Methanosarcina mazei]|uniref:Uncharacterized protein n=1 Tax=Methanosarcina mazei TaxID=2209 RepID=A0A0F8HC53_METMZ|nr:hypothetical protein [Methanosarcina mazei]KKG34638.1 hypothetical protein DU30_00385 [Methanosarcina mazei]KKG64494.1 hypothetical protein DU67_07455 [Methanosarcina mazei]